MARIRTIKPEFWSDEKLSECSLSARLLFVGLWSFADDEGRMEYQPARIRMQVFPCGTVPVKKLTEMLGELTERSLIRVYVVDSREYLDIPNFAKHQRINRPTPSKLPPHSLSPHGTIIEPSPALSESSPLEGKGKERKGVRGALKRSRAPEEFSPDLDYARSQLPDVDAEREAQKFRDWEFKTPRSDWPACWRTWIGNCRESGKYARMPKSTPMVVNGKPVEWQ